MVQPRDGHANTHGRHVGERRELLTGQIEPRKVLLGVDARMGLDKAGPLFEKVSVPPTALQVHRVLDRVVLGKVRHVCLLGGLYAGSADSRRGHDVNFYNFKLKLVFTRDEVEVTLDNVVDAHPTPY